ncbi:ATP-binding cassette domain-containing protein [Streptomyces sp. Da 82-17]|uniref:ATP-binding cassette domain-containing protein n=1 Tax=Streptomyces sp. Da 82-17 TaxID=3377116 RepID=UPI0038D4B854
MNTPPAPAPAPAPTTRHADAGPVPLLDVRELVVRYGPVTAVDRVSFTVAAGETVGLYGPSGCGKSSTAEAVLQLRRPQGGEVWFDGTELTALGERLLRPLRPRFQPVFQDPYGSLSPRRRIRDQLAEPLRVQGHTRGGETRDDTPGGTAARDGRHGGRTTRRAARERVAELLDLVGLDPSCGERLPHELSGGQCQRAGIARALASEPRLIVLDEPVSALDPSLRAGIVNLLLDLQDRLGLGYLFICHDPVLVRHVCDRVLTMREGRLVEGAGLPGTEPATVF